MCASNIPLLHTTILIVLLHTYPSLKVNNVSPGGDSSTMNDVTVTRQIATWANRKCHWIILLSYFFFATVSWRNKKNILSVIADVAAFHLKYAGSLGNTLQHAGLVAVLQEDGSVVVNILHLDEHSGCACSPTACWTVVCVWKQTGRCVGKCWHWGGRLSGSRVTFRCFWAVTVCLI